MNVTVCSQVLSFALRDFNTRHDIRKQSRAMFRNFVCTLVELYPVYRKIDKCLSACLIDPLFRCLKMLVSEDPDDRDLHCLANVIVNYGQQLSLLNNSECERLIMACRRWLCSNNIMIEEETKRLLMIAIDLWTYSWDRNLFPDCLNRFYRQLNEEEQQKATTKLKSKEFPEPEDPPQMLSDTIKNLSINKAAHCKSSSPFNKKNDVNKKLPQRPSSAAIILEDENINLKTQKCHKSSGSLMGQSVLSVYNLIDNDENKILKANLEEIEVKKEKESII
uniref:Uncharacterized protein n=1 Tax=Meloidogyne incognita TaxID=6306 RepID=A0A914LGG4_MELIC